MYVSCFIRITETNIFTFLMHNCLIHLHYHSTRQKIASEITNRLDGVLVLHTPDGTPNVNIVEAALLSSIHIFSW